MVTVCRSFCLISQRRLTTSREMPWAFTLTPRTRIGERHHVDNRARQFRAVHADQTSVFEMTKCSVSPLTFTVSSTRPLCHQESGFANRISSAVTLLQDQHLFIGSRVSSLCEYGAYQSLAVSRRLPHAPRIERRCQPRAVAGRLVLTTRIVLIFSMQCRRLFFD